MIMKLIYTPKSRNDLKEIENYISINLSSPKAATNVISKIIKSCSNLKDFPALGAELKNKFDVNTEIRYLIISNYIAFYKYENETIKIIRILDGRTNYLRYLFEM